MRQSLARWEEIVAGLALAVVFFSVVWGVIARYIAPQPAAWSNEVATIGFAWVVFLGAAAGAKRHLHVGVDVLTSRLPAAVKRPVAIVVAVFLAVALAYVAWLALKIGYLSRGRPTPILRLPLTIVHAALAIGFASMAIQSLRDAAALYRANDD